MPTKAELKQQAEHIKLKIRKGDTVMIISGKDKGRVGTVALVSPKENKAIVVADDPENPDQKIALNAVIKHFKAKHQGQKSARIKLPSPIHISNLMVVDPSTKKPTRIGRRKEKDSVVRYYKGSGKTIKETTDADLLARREEEKKK